MTGIYCIRNLFDGKEYIGSSAEGFTARWNKHRRGLRLGIHHSYLLQKAWDMCGETAFEFSVIEECPPDRCIEREQYWIDALDPYYNICRVAGSWLGRKHTPEARAKISTAKAGNKYSLGHHLSPEARAKLSGQHTGSHPTPETRAKLSEAKRGRPRPPFSLETRAKMSAAAMGHKRSLGHIQTPEHRSKISAAGMGHPHYGPKHHTKEARARMRAAWVLRRKHLTPVISIT